MLKIGLGYDFHLLVEERPLMLGGTHVPFNKGEKAHSDGDVLLHAITDALLGAHGKTDLGELFPPSDVTWKGASSAMLLDIAWQKVKEDGWHLVNLDCVVVMQEPKLNPYRKSVISSIANILKVDEDSVFVKFKTHEHTGDIGKGDAIASFATVLISNSQE